MALRNERIDSKIVDKFVKGKSNGVTTALFYLMKELNMSYSDIYEMPVPAIFVLLEELKDHSEREEKAHKKAYRKK